MTESNKESVERLNKLQDKKLRCLEQEAEIAQNIENYWHEAQMIKRKREKTFLEIVNEVKSYLDFLKNLCLPKETKQFYDSMKRLIEQEENYERKYATSMGKFLEEKERQRDNAKEQLKIHEEIEELKGGDENGR